MGFGNNAMTDTVNIEKYDKMGELEIKKTRKES